MGIDPRSKQTTDSKSPAVSVSVSHSVSVAVQPKLKLAEKTSTATVLNVPRLTTTAHPTFNLVEPVRAVASTESYDQQGGEVALNATESHRHSHSCWQGAEHQFSSS